MSSPIDIIETTRKSIYQKDKTNFDDICFTIFRCSNCSREKLDMTLLPLVDKENFSKIEIRKAHEKILGQIFDADFDFLHEKGSCDCGTTTPLELRRVVYCFNEDDTDFHNYIDYPFEEILKLQIDLIETKSNKTFLFFDTETTGLPKNWNASYEDLNNWPRLVQIAWIIGDEQGNIKEQDSYIIKPEGFKIPSGATDIHRISHENALQNGLELSFILDKFNKIVREVDFLVAHNINFDINVIASEMFRFKIDSDIFKKEQICTMKQTVNFCKLPSSYGYKYPKLSELYYKLFQTNFDEAHNASVDIKATFKCFYELINNNTIKLYKNV